MYALIWFEFILLVLMLIFLILTFILGFNPSETIILFLERCLLVVSVGLAVIFCCALTHEE